MSLRRIVVKSFECSIYSCAADFCVIHKLDEYAASNGCSCKQKTIFPTHVNGM